MVEWSVILEHAQALMLLWGAVGITGFTLLSLLRIQSGIASAPLLGIVFWALAIYLFPFAGGLHVASAAVLLLLAWQMGRWWRTGTWTPFWRSFSWSTLILVIGSLAYSTTVWCSYVPAGMDGSMYAEVAALIARSRGLPGDFAPIAGSVGFPAMNLGLPAAAAVAMMWGGEGSAVMVASHHLTFTCLILATYVLLRWWTSRTSAAVLAVASAWLARASQASLGWGGFPTVMSVAVGILAARLLLQHSRSCSWRLALATGAVIASVPLLHGVGAGTWLYCVAPWISLATLAIARHRAVAVRGLAITALCAVGFLVVYRVSGGLSVKPTDVEDTRRFVQAMAPKTDGWRAWTEALDFVRKDSGSLIVLAGWCACVVLAFHRRWTAALLLTAAWLTITMVVANARWYVLPGTFVLYPDRVIYWSAPLSAVALALAWNEVRETAERIGELRGSGGTWLWHWSAALALGLLVVSAYFQNQFYQRIVREEFVDHDRWEALVWARRHLKPNEHFVHAGYNTTGSFLPGVALVDCDGAHRHHFVARQFREAQARRSCTHRFLENDTGADAALLDGQIVFHNRAVTVLALPLETNR